MAGLDLARLASGASVVRGRAVALSRSSDLTAVNKLEHAMENCRRNFCQIWIMLMRQDLKKVDSAYWSALHLCTLKLKSAAKLSCFEHILGGLRIKEKPKKLKMKLKDIL